MGSDNDEDAERRMQRAMDKLFSSAPIQTTSSCSSSPPTKFWDVAASERVLPLTLGEKAPSSAEKNGGKLTSSSTPICRPWDREDLFRRLGTFKSVSWFGKPSAAGPVACALKGWVNVDLDLICCEVCGSRLSFSLPATWTKQQVETAGLEFARKLDNGHKPLCPWKGNGCSEELAAFPPTQASVLIQGYEERVQALLSLSALPVVSSSAVEYMKLSRRDQVTSFLRPQSNDIVLQELEAAQGEAIQTLREKYEAFLQAQKLIGLCGWEVRLLPYAVDEHDSSADSQGLRISLATGSDPRSTVLECGLCRASAGLWSFSALSRTSLSLSAILSTIQASSKKRVEIPSSAINTPVDEDTTENVDVNAETTIAKDTNNTSVIDKLEPVLDLCLTIAGGPRPTRITGAFPAAIPIPGLYSQQERSNLSEEKSTPEQEPAEKPSVQDKSRNKRKRYRDSGQRKKLKGVEGVVQASSSVNAVATSYNHNRHENSAESVECSPQRSNDEQDTVLSRENTDNQEVAREATVLTGVPSEFDPIHQHRYFCPWINSNSAAQCGWQMTIDALHATISSSAFGGDREKAAGAINKMDPLVSVRKMLGGKGKDVAVDGGTLSLGRVTPT